MCSLQDYHFEGDLILIYACSCEVSLGFITIHHRALQRVSQPNGCYTEFTKMEFTSLFLGGAELGGEGQFPLWILPYLFFSFLPKNKRMHTW